MYNDKQPSQVMPVKDKELQRNIDDILADVADKLKSKNPALHLNYKKGIMFAQNNVSSEEIQNDKFIKSIIDCLFLCLRDQIIEIEDVELRQEQLIKLSAVEKVFMDGINLLQVLNFKLDKNSVVPIMQGYINECTKKLVQK